MSTLIELGKVSRETKGPQGICENVITDPTALDQQTPFQACVDESTLGCYSSTEVDPFGFCKAHL